MTDLQSFKWLKIKDSPSWTIKKKKNNKVEEDQAKTAEKKGVKEYYIIYFLHAASSLCLPVFSWSKETTSLSVEGEQRKLI